MREIIDRKLRTKNFSSITEEERNYIFKNNNYILELLETYYMDLSYWWDSNDLFLDFLLRKEDIISSENMQKYYYYYLRANMLNTDTIDTNFLTAAKSLLKKPSYLENIYLLYEELLQKDLEESEYECSTDNYLFLCSRNRFDLASKVKKINGYYKDNIFISTFISNYPFEKYPLPLFLLSSLTNNGELELRNKELLSKIDVKYIPLNILFTILVTDTYTKREELERERQIHLEIIKRIEDSSEEIFSLFKDSNSLFASIANSKFSMYNKDFLNRVATLLIDKNCFFFIDYVMKNKLINESTIIQKVSSLIDNKESFGTFKFAMRNSNLNINHFFTKNNADALIKNGHLSILLACDFLRDDSICAKVVEEIKNKNPLYIDDINNLNVSIYQYPDIFEQIIASGYLVDIGDLFIYYTGINTRMSECNKMLAKFISQTKNLNLPEKYTINNELVSAVIDGGYYEYFIKFISATNLKISDNWANSFVKMLKSNPDAMKFSKKYYELFAVKNPILFNFALTVDNYDKGVLLDSINHIDNTDMYLTYENALLFCDYIDKGLKLVSTGGSHIPAKKENYIYLIDTFGPNILKYLDNTNIMYLLLIDINLLKKICALFEERSFDISDLASSYDAIKQYEFHKKNENVVSIFTLINTSIENRNDSYKKHIGDMLPYLGQKFFVKFQEKYKLPSKIKNSEELLDYIVNKLISGTNTHKYKSLLHVITDYYIGRKREEYRRNSDMYSDMEIPFNYDEGKLDEALLDYLIKNNLKYSTSEGTFYFHELLDSFLQTKGYGENMGLLFCMIYSVPQRIESSFGALESKLPKKDFGNIKKLALEYIRSMGSTFSEARLLVKREAQVKKNYYVPEREVDYYRILGQIDIQNFLESVVQKEEVYNSLLSTMKKRKLHLLPNILIDFMNSLGLDLDYSYNNLNTFLTYYGDIYARKIGILSASNADVKNVILTFPAVIKNTKIYGGELGYFNQVLGTDDARIIKLNEGPNAAITKIANNERLIRSVDFTINNYERMEVTTPTFNNVFTIGNHDIRVILGNFTHPSNLTHGERTGSCMRVGGMGESLFNFILKNINGFHIRFEDAKTGEYISRVSGFRNGNTVFLNQLRDSLAFYKCTNEELFNICKLASEKIIDMSRNSTFPIDNVVVSCSYATTSHISESISLGNIDIKKGLPNFYTDIYSGKVIVLATTSKNEKSPLIVLDTENLPVYKPARDELKYSNDEKEMAGIIGRVNAVQALLENRENAVYRIVPPNFENGFLYGIANNDWYIYVDGNYNIHECLIAIDKRAELELKNAREMLHKMLEDEKKFSS